MLRKLHPKIAAVLMLLLIVAGTAQSVQALGTTYYSDTGGGATCDVSGCNNTVIALRVGQTSYSHNTQGHLIAYFTANSGQVVIDDPNFCPGGGSLSDNLAAGDYFYNNPMADGTSVTRYSVSSASNTTQFGVKYKSSDGRCNGQLTFDVSSLPKDSNLGLWYATIDVLPVDNHAGPCNAGSNSGCDGVQNDYKVHVQGGSGYAIAQAAGGTGYQVATNQSSGSASNVDYTIRFGSDCSVPGKGQTRDLTYWDLDNKGNNGSQLNGLITMELWDDTTNKLVDQWTPPDGNNVLSSHSFTFQPNTKYRWIMKNVYTGNTIQFGTPYDGIYYDKPCGVSLSPSPLPLPPPPPPPPPQPYFQATGGDVVAGASMATTTSGVVQPCKAAQNITSAGIVSWNNDGKPDFAGAGGEYAAMAFNYVQDFVTGRAKGVIDGTTASQLTFANVDTANSIKPSAGLFGGMFGGAPCADLWNNHPTTISAPPSPTIGNWPSGTYYITSNLQLNAGPPILPGVHLTLYVDSNVYVNGNVSYAAGPYSNRANIPSLKLIVHGVLYIDKAVTQLDGLYAAIPDNNYAAPTTKNIFSAPRPGTISTCSTNSSGSFSSYDPSQILTTSKTMAVDCNQPLVIDGSVVAEQLWLLRTRGSLASKLPAEIVNYDPEIWLAPSGSSGAGSAQYYQSIIGLPPTL